MNKDERRLKVLEAIVDAYIKTGEPVGSSLICSMLDENVSPATVRNDMASLTKLGFLKQPHTSAGRLPTFSGFRMYINRLMKPVEINDEFKRYVNKKLKDDMSTVSGVIENAITALSEITELTTFSTTNSPGFSVISKVEVIPAGRRLYAILLITSTGEVKNKICRMQFDLTDSQISYFANLINKETVGLPTNEINPETFKNLAASLGGYFLALSPLLYAFYKLSDEISKNNVHVKGENKLLKCDEFDPHELVEFIYKKDKIRNLLNSSFNGLNIVFGKENDTFTIGNSSMIISSFGKESNLGSFGVIGPIRLDYKKIIPYITYFSNSISTIINNILEDKELKNDDFEDK